MTTPKKEPSISLPFTKRVLSKLSYLAQFSLGLCLLVLIFIASQQVTSYFEIKLPPALLGIGVLLLLLLALRKVPMFIQTGARPMLSHMVLFLIPAIVTIVAHFALILEFPLVLLLAIVGTTVLSLFITAVISQKLMGKYQ